LTLPTASPIRKEINFGYSSIYKVPFSDVCCLLDVPVFGCFFPSTFSTRTGICCLVDDVLTSFVETAVATFLPVDPLLGDVD